MSEIISNEVDELLEMKTRLWGSLLLFIQVFYKLLNGREFIITAPVGRESHQITICRELMKMFRLETNRLVINVPPGYGKSTMLIYFIAWAMSRYPDCQFIYVSYSKDLAAKHTFTIKQIMSLPYYRKLFGVEIRRDSSAKDNFTTTDGGCIAAFGSEGAITGRDAGLPGMIRFSGCVVMDDMHKPDEVHSDTIRERVIKNYNETLKERPRSPNVPLFCIGQRLREGDLPEYLLEGKDGYQWSRVILKALDEAGNALNPMVRTKEMLLTEQKFNPYVFSAQHQQEPQPAGGGIFKPEWFPLLDEDPEILATFITADSAETADEWNDATVFSFWGIYKLKQFNIETDLYGLHWINCVELRVEPKDLESEFLQFYASCMRYHVKPLVAAIERKSTGVTLCSTLDDMQGLRIIEIKRTNDESIDKEARYINKIARFLSVQKYAAAKYISLPRYGKHTHMCKEHMRKITANNTHDHDDIADTFYDAIKVGLIDKIITMGLQQRDEASQTTTLIAEHFSRVQQARRAALCQR